MTCALGYVLILYGEIDVEHFLDEQVSCMVVFTSCVHVLTHSKEMFLQSEAKSRLAAQIAAKYDWRSPNRGVSGDSRPKPSFLNTINQVLIIYSTAQRYM